MVNLLFISGLIMTVILMWLKTTTALVDFNMQVKAFEGVCAMRWRIVFCLEIFAAT